jgi:putative ABC transport system permease protein
VGAVGMVAGGEIRRHWRSVIALTLLVGAVGALVLATAAGARRTASALARFDTATRVDDAELLGAFQYTPTPAQLRALRRVRDVSAVAVLRFYAVAPVHVPPNVLSSGMPAAVDRRFGTSVNRGRLVAGRRADPAAVDEIDLGETLARRLHLGVGDPLDIVSYTPTQLAAAGGPPPKPEGPRVRLRVVGLVGPGDLGLAGQVVVLTPAFNRAYFDRIGNFGVLMTIRTAHGASDVAAVVAAARRIFKASGGVSLQSSPAASQGAQNAIDVLTLALWIFAGVAALAGIVTIGIVLTRENSQVIIEQATLRALGVTRRQRFLISGPRALLIAGGGGLLAVLGAILASPLFPIGLARRADPDVGFHADATALALGVVAVVGGVLTIAAVASYRSTRRSTFEAVPDGRRRGSAFVGVASRAGVAPSVTNGLRMALEPGRGENAVPIRSAYLGAVFGVLGVIAVLVFASSLDHLVATPRLYASNWDFHAVDTKFNDDGAGTCNRNDFGLRRQPGVGAVAALCINDISLDHRGTTGWGFTPLRGGIGPEIVAGRAPRTRTEVALGLETLAASGKQIGDTVEARGPHGSIRYRIVGRAEFPTLDDPYALADGAAFTGAGLTRIFDTNASANRYLVGRFAPGADRAATERRIAALPGLGNAEKNVVPVEVDRLRHVGWFPVTLAALLGGLALVAVGHALVTAVRRRGRELALLKTLGFNRRQVRATVAWQATTLAAVGLLIGIPIGLIVGNQVWHLVAAGIGVPTAAAIPVVPVALTIPLVLVLVNLTAFLPARTAARTRPAVALRSE